ncbi:MAG TPA: GTPase ObgE [Actinomycetota bacterium]|nr:GTPase ObgE [Actinomycetota bacterium]
MAFVDEAKVKVIAGAGGNGIVAWHREPYKPKGGPDGGDGGDGGSVLLRADTSVGTLLELRDHPHIKADRGGHGQGKRRHGARGADRVVKVPVGTVVYDEDGVLLADLANVGDEFVAARGGRGGRGNARFASAVRQAPAFAENGEPGDERWLKLELRLLADVGLVGFPNAGKSTLISRISAARPKIADYPFTTLVPNLGSVTRAETSFVVADIPGLVPGAHEGKGLGDQFLRHVSRAAVLVFVIDLAAVDREPTEDVRMLRRELEAFDAELAARPALVVANKVDVGKNRLEAVLESQPDALPISAVTGEGVDVFLDVLVEAVTSARSATPAATGYVRHVVPADAIKVITEGSAWRVTGSAVERAVGATDMNNDEAVARLQRRLISLGVERELARAGAKRGDEVRIGNTAFDFIPEGDADGET